MKKLGITREEADENVRRAGYGVEVELLEKHTIDRYTNDNHATEICTWYEGL